VIDRKKNDEAEVERIEERRRNAALRTLVQQMMEELRSAVNHDQWETGERERAERDLERIMEQVRRETFRDRK
jgi:hypothetical protein